VSQRRTGRRRQVRDAVSVPVRDRIAAFRRASELEAQVASLEATLDHERLYPLEWVSRRIRDRFGYSVLRGPFAGLRYPQHLALAIEAYPAKLLGTYEEELHAAVEEFVQTEPAIVVNVGASDGYYAVGLACRLPGAVVHAFDTNEAHHPVLREVAAENEVGDRLRIGGECDTATLETVLQANDSQRGALVVCDCEGCEAAVLHPERAPSLATSSLLIECHDLIHDGITSTLERRFGATHDIELISTGPRWICNHPELSFLPVVTQIMAIHEYREGPMHWMVARPR
jgi:hypothetical protein